MYIGTQITNILNTRKKRNIAAVIFLVILALAILGVLIACNVIKTPQEQENTQPDMAVLRGEYFDFAIKYRLDYIPLFEEGKAPTDSTEYLFWAFAINLDNWGEDKGKMTRGYVDTAIHDHFEVGGITHTSMRKCWDYDGEKYVAVPGSIGEKPLYALKEYSEDGNSGRTVYTITLSQCAYINYPPSAEDMANYRAAIAAGDLTNLTVTRTETFRFYLNEKTGEPVFLSHTLPPAQAFLDNTGEDELKKIVLDADYLIAMRGSTRFDSASELTQSDIFNLYASTDAVQSRMKGASGDYLELSVTDITAFFSDYFGDYPFDPEKLIAARSGNSTRFRYDKQKGSLFLSTVNGGVFRPSSIPYELTIDSCSPDGNMLTVKATRSYAGEPPNVDELYAITLTLKITDTGFHYVSYFRQPLTDKKSLQEKYYNYFTGHSRQVNPLFAFPNDDKATLDANLMVFAFQNLEAPDFENGSTRAEIDAVLSKYFGRTVNDYNTSYSVSLVNGNVVPSGWSFHGCNRLVLTRLSAENDGSLTGVFDVYYIPEGEETLAAIDEALSKGNTAKYHSYFSQSVTINWREIADESEPRGFYIRYNSILPGKAQDWSAGRGGNATFFFVGGNFLGSYENGEWVSLTDPDGQDYDQSRHSRFLIKDLLGRGYAIYSREKNLGQASEAVLYAGQGPSGFPDGDKTILFSPYAKRKYDSFCVLPLPAELSGGELDTLTVPYGFSLFMGNDMDIKGEIKAPALATNAHMVPPNGIVWADGVSSSDMAALQKVLTKNNVKYNDPAVTAATGDFDSDGKMETIVFANARVNSAGYLDIKAENETLFSLILMRDDDGSYQMVYSQFIPYTDDVTAHFRTLPIGVFDLNGDGIHEICVKAIGWEGGSTFVLSKNTQGIWKKVLLAAWGS